MVMIPNLAVVPDPNVNPSLGSVAFPDTYERAPAALVDPGDILAKFLRVAVTRVLRSSVRVYFEGELVAADADMVAVRQRGAASDAPASYQDAVGRSQVADDETACGIDDDSVVAADIVVVENNVVVGTAADSVRRLQLVALSVVSAQRGDG